MVNRRIVRTVTISRKRGRQRLAKNSRPFQALLSEGGSVRVNSESSGVMNRPSDRGMSSR